MNVNNIQVRNTNKKRILKLLYKQTGMTKQEIAEILNLSLPTVSQILKELTQLGLVSKSGVAESSGGRKPALNTILYDAKFSSGIEVTQNHLKFVLIDLSGNLKYYRKLSLKYFNGKEYYDKVAQLFEAFLTENHIKRNKLLGVGIALPGIIREKDNVLEYAPTLKMHELPLKQYADVIGYKVKFGNEANLAGYAEVWSIEHIQDAVFLSINKGVGGAILINNSVYNGVNFRSGEFGHMTIVKNGLECSCGRRGCFEAYCSTKRLTGDKFDDIDGFFAALEHGDEQCKNIWEEYLDNLATGINNIRMILDSDVIIGGEIGQYIGKYIDCLNDKVRARNSFNDPADYIYISRFGGKAGAVGAALLFVDEFINR